MSEKTVKKPVNVRRPEVMAQVEEDLRCYHSDLVDQIRANGNSLELPGMHLRLASAFGFCDGVKRAIEIAYATCRYFPGKRIWLIGEIIHNPEVNARLDAMGVRRLPWITDDPLYDELIPEDVVIMPAFGVSVPMRRLLDEKRVNLVDSTCGNVIKVWQRVKQYASLGITSVIHGKARHEESMATASQSRGPQQDGHYVVIFNEEEAEILSQYIEGKGNRDEFMARFAKAVSPGFDPDIHLQEIGIANQTTMLKSETVSIQRRLREAVVARDGNDARFHMFDTICGATQDRQNALFELLEEPLDIMLIIGGYNSSNTTHLAQIASRKMPSFFVKSADCFQDLETVRCFDLKEKKEVQKSLPECVADTQRVLRVGLTAGASCPPNVIEDVICRLVELRNCLNM